MKKTNHARMGDLLPVVTAGGIITGIVAEDHQVNQPGHTYQRCCQDVRDWRGTGGSYRLYPLTDPQGRGDPYYRHGYRSHRAVVCGTCGGHVIATEYLTAPVAALEAGGAEQKEG